MVDPDEDPSCILDTIIRSLGATPIFGPAGRGQIDQSDQALRIVPKHRKKITYTIIDIVIDNSFVFANDRKRYHSGTPKKIDESLAGRKMRMNEIQQSHFSTIIRKWRQNIHSKNLTGEPGLFEVHEIVIPDFLSVPPQQTFDVILEGAFYI